MPLRQRLTATVATVLATLTLGAAPALAAPANDDFADAPTIDERTAVRVELADATMEDGEPGYGRGIKPKTVWLRVTGLRGSLRIGTDSSAASVRVYTGTRVDALTKVSWEPPLGSWGAWVADPAVTYHVQVASEYHSATYTLRLEAGPEDFVSYRSEPDEDGYGTWWRHVGHGGRELITRFATPDGWSAHVLADLDGDGLDRITSYHPETGRWWETVGDTGAQRRLTTFGTRTGWAAHLAGDVDGDERDELLSFHPSNGSWWITRVTEDGVAVQRRLTTFGTRTGWQAHQVADVDGDGRDELWSYHPSNGTWWRTTVTPDGTAVQRVVTTYGTREGWDAHLVADVTGDATPELASFHAGTESWWVTQLSGDAPHQRRLASFAEVRDARWTAHTTANFLGGPHTLLSLDQTTGRWYQPWNGGAVWSERQLDPPTGWDAHMSGALRR